MNKNCPPTSAQSQHSSFNTYFLLRAKCWVRGGVGGQFPGTPISLELLEWQRTLSGFGESENSGT